MELEYLFKKRFIKIKDGKKSYIHFDPPFCITKRKWLLKKDFLNSKHIKNHHFYPFISSTLTSVKFKNHKGKRKLENKKRPICYSWHYDSLILSRYAYILQHHYELFIKKLWFSECPIAYRKIEVIDENTNKKRGSSNIDFAKEAFNYIQKNWPCVALTFDIEKFFETLDRWILKRKWKQILWTEELPEDHYHLFKILTNFRKIDKTVILEKLKINTKQKKAQAMKLGYIHNQDRREVLNEIFWKYKLIQNNPNKTQKRGIPQWSAISSVLSNLYMIDFDIELAELAKKYWALYRRYCDDIVIVCSFENKKEFIDIVYEQIQEMKLNIQTKKEDRTIFKLDEKWNLRWYYDMEDAKNIERNNKWKWLCIYKKKGDNLCITNWCNFKNKCKTINKKMQYLWFLFDWEEIEIRPWSMSNYRQKMVTAIKKTVFQAKWKNSKSTIVFKKQLFNKYTKYGKTNFITYLQRAGKTIKSKRIYKQLKHHVKNINTLIKRYI